MTEGPPGTGCVATAKVAVTSRSAVIVTGQVPVAEHPPPLQPVKTDPVEATATSVTVVPGLNEASHVSPQAMAPPGVGLEMLPLPAPAFATDRRYVVAAPGWQLGVAHLTTFNEFDPLKVMTGAGLPRLRSPSGRIAHSSPRTIVLAPVQAGLAHLATFSGPSAVM